MALRGEANRRLVPTRLLQQFTGNACSTSRAVRNARFHFRSLYYCTALTRPHSRLSRTALQDLEVWTHFQYDSQLNSVPLFTSPTSRTLYTDASSGVGWGGVLPPLHMQELTLGRGPAPAAHQLQGTAGCSPQSVGLTIGPPRTSRLAVLRQHHRRPAPSQGDKPFATGCWTGTLVADSFGKVCYCPLALRL